MEQILAGENFHKVVNEATEEEVLNCWKESLLYDRSSIKRNDSAKSYLITRSDDLEKEENADRDDEQNEDILEPQKERNEEQEESASGEKLEKKLVSQRNQMSWIQ